MLNMFPSHDHVGGRSTYVGSNAGRYAASGSENVAIGYDAGAAYHKTCLTSTMQKCVAIGKDAMKSCDKDFSVAVGVGALQVASGSGQRLTAFGYAAGASVVDPGSYAHFIGWGAGSNAKSLGSHNIFIGRNAGDYARDGGAIVTGKQH